MPESVTGGLVTAVAPGSVAQELQVGDRVVAVNDSPVRDVIDWLWHTDEATVRISVVRDGVPVSITVTRSSAQPLGVEFADTVFDGVKQCDNACTFCFIAGLPAGLRRSLYVRDDDFRLSFLSGNFITLTNTDDADISRILSQHLSPLHVSVHAVDPGVRARLICPTVADEALERLDRLLAGGIEVHVQIVLVPGVNDGAVLDETLEYLARRPGVVSVGCVPMGFTEHQQRFSASYVADTAAAVLDRVARWQQRMRAERGSGWVYAADEFFLLGSCQLPEAGAYDDFPQYENGIGMAAAFREEFVVSAGALPADATVVTGELFAPVLRAVLDDAGFNCVRVLPVQNRLFGGNVSVTGLLGGSDIARAIALHGGAGTYLLPDVVVNSDGLLLDDVPACTLAALSGADVRIIGSDAGSLADALTPEEGRAPL